MSHIPSLSKLSLAPAPVSAPEANAPTLDPNAEEPEEGEITEPNWETALGVVAKALLEKLDPERCKDPAKMCIASKAFNKEWCQNPLFGLRCREAGLSEITRTTTYDDNPTRTRGVSAGVQEGRRARSAHQDTARPPFGSTGGV